jgi:alpha-N-acetylglucosaminidase
LLINYLQGNILVLDLQSEQHPQYNRTKSFYGQPFVWCMLHNFGGTLGMHGSIRLVNEEIPRAAAMQDSSMVGVGITPEGIHQNFVVYEFALDKAWQYEEVNRKKWIKHYARNRYGFESKVIEHAWLLLLRSVYAFEGDRNIRGKYTFCRRPSLRLQPFSWYSEKDVRKAIGKFVTIATNESFVLNELFERDLVDLSRQLLQNQADALYLNLVDAYKKKNSTELDSLSQKFVDLLADLDALLLSHNDFLLGNFLEAAKARGFDESERKQLEFNARNQITLWGPNGQINDYATKQWSGIVKDYYLPRWSLFFTQLKASLEQNVPFSQSGFQADVFKRVEYPFNINRKIYPTLPQGEFAPHRKLI